MSATLGKVGVLQQNFQRHYRSQPTHGIGRYRHLLPPEEPKKRKNHVEMKEIDPGTEHQYGTLNIVLTGYDVSLIKQLAATFSPIFLEIIQNNLPEGIHLLVKEHTEEDFRIRLKVRPELDELRAKLQ
ncbi:hypothetical protein Chor_010462 [Crotalus horridus]